MRWISCAIKTEIVQHFGMGVLGVASPSYSHCLKEKVMREDKKGEKDLAASLSLPSKSLSILLDIHILWVLMHSFSSGSPLVG